MRPIALLLTGLTLIGAGIAMLLSRLPGHVVIGIALIVVGVLVKLGGFLVGDDPVRAKPGGRRVTTLDGQVVEAPRPGVPTGRASFARPQPQPQPQPRPARAARPAPQAPATPLRRAG